MLVIRKNALYSFFVFGFLYQIATFNADAYVTQTRYGNIPYPAFEDTLKNKKQVLATEAHKPDIMRRAHPGSFSPKNTGVQDIFKANWIAYHTIGELKSPTSSDTIWEHTPIEM
jgi:hypothetical protein